MTDTSMGKDTKGITEQSKIYSKITEVSEESVDTEVYILIHFNYPQSRKRLSGKGIWK